MSSPQVFENDPYLQYQPGYAYTLPIQLFVNGITVTLLCVLFIHLLFTAQYHYPLAPLNYILQFTSVLVCLISVAIKVTVVLKFCSDSGDVWPYSLNYVAVSIPPPWWNTAQSAFWFLLQALCFGLSNITHIQFLTLLFPSRTEARLIIFVLGPLAIAASGLVFVAMANSQTALDIGDAIRNTLNSTLLLIFTIALLIWGLVVNRRRAWRSDGGTAVFGLGSLTLAVISTTFNFVAIAEDGIDWLQHLLFAAVLWQIWLGWWWWVGSGMGIGEVEDIMNKAERKKRKAAKRAAKIRAANAHNKRARAAGPEAPSAAATAVSGLTSSVTGILRNRSFRSNSGLRRRTSQSVHSGSPMGDVEEGIELEDIGNEAPAAVRAGSTPSPQQQQQRVEFTPSTDPSRIQPSSNSETSSTSRTPSLHVPETMAQFFSFPTLWLQVYLRRLRHAHEDATQKQVMERAELRKRVFAGGVAGEGSGGGRRSRRARTARSARFSEMDNTPHAINEAEVAGGSNNEFRAEEGASVGTPIQPDSGDAARRRSLGALADEDGVGWGLGSFGIKEHEASARRLREAEEVIRANRLLSGEQRRAQRDDTAEAGASSSGGAGAAAAAAAGATGAAIEEGTTNAGEANGTIAIAPGPRIGPDAAGGIGGSRPPRQYPIDSDGEGHATGRREQNTAIAPDAAGANGARAVTAADDTRASAARSAARRRGDQDWEDVDTGSSTGSLSSDDEENERRRTGSGWSWWGPLKHLRRADRSDF